MNIVATLSHPLTGKYSTSFPYSENTLSGKNTRHAGNLISISACWHNGPNSLASHPFSVMLGGTTLCDLAVLPQSHPFSSNEQGKLPKYSRTQSLHVEAFKSHKRINQKRPEFTWFALHQTLVLCWAAYILQGLQLIVEEWHPLLPEHHTSQMNTTCLNHSTINWILDVKLFAISLCANIAWWFFLLVRYLQWIGISQLRLKSSVSHGNHALCAAQPIAIDKWTYFYWT